MKNYLIPLLLFISMLAAKASVQDSVGVRQLDGTNHVEYLVSPGETIYKISTKYGVPISRLMEVNPELENGLRAGQTILVPYDKALVERKEVKPTPSIPKLPTKVEEKKQPVQQKAAQKESKTHTVQAGETLYSVSRKYGVSVGDLLKWNGLELQPGQEIVVGYDETVKEEKQVEEAVEEPIDAVVETPKKEEKAPLPVLHQVSQNAAGEDYTVYEFDSTRKQVLIIPFDPHLYFSDSDDEIARSSRIPRIKVREVFRRRLNALLEPKGYESIYLLGAKAADTLNDLNRIYGSVKYTFKDVKHSQAYLDKQAEEENTQKKTTGKGVDNVKKWVNKQKGRITNNQSSDGARQEKFFGKFVGVEVGDTRLFDYLHRKYSTDYIIFVNQFEIKTDYSHCLDRSTGNYERNFIAHFSIFDHEGQLVAGDKFKVHYNSNNNNVNKIVGDNMLEIAEHILLELPPAGGN